VVKISKKFHVESTFLLTFGYSIRARAFILIQKEYFDLKRTKLQKREEKCIKRSFIIVFCVACY